MDEFKLIEKQGDWRKYAYESHIFVICRDSFYKTKWVCGRYMGSHKHEGFKSMTEAKNYIRDHYYLMIEQGE